MIIVAGAIYVEAGKRELFLSGSLDAIAQARETPGCRDFAVSSDAVEPDRVNVFELWETYEALEHFRGDGPGEDLSALIVRADVDIYHCRSS